MVLSSTMAHFHRRMLALSMVTAVLIVNGSAASQQPATGFVLGRVLDASTGQPISGAQVTLARLADTAGPPAPGPPAPPLTKTVVTNGDFPSVPPGPYDLRTVASATTGSTGAAWVLESAIASGHDVADGTLDIGPGQEISGVMVTLTDQETEIWGTLLDSAKRPTAQFSLLFFSVDRTSWTSRSRRVQTVQPAVDGTFKVKGLPPGEYYVVGDANIDSGTVLDAAYLEQLTAVASRVTIARGEKRRVDLAVTAR